MTAEPKCSVWPSSLVPTSTSSGNVDTWRNPTPQDGAYLAKLIEWGYEPSDIERTILGEEAAS